jgi:4-diphosphocytidyl-2-C-methyl-D-erythritol kinase
MAVSVFSPAKINLFLAVTGRRSDGFHDLVSVAAPLDFGDTLRAEIGGRGFSLECDHPEVPRDASNLVLRAAEAFATATGWREPVRFHLAKRIPPGAGLGGGSSNAVAALLALSQLAGAPLAPAQVETLAAGLGSDCVLFLRQAPVVMRGRGERVELLPAPAAARLRGRQVLLFKPSFGISTPWAYGRMVARRTDYLAAPAAEARLAAWLGSDAPAEDLIFNNMEPAAFEKYGALPLLLGSLNGQGRKAAMSGSGSACYALVRDEAAARSLEGHIRARWGDAAFVQAARLA